MKPEGIGTTDDCGYLEPQQHENSLSDGLSHDGMDASRVVAQRGTYWIVGCNDGEGIPDSLQGLTQAQRRVSQFPQKEVAAHASQRVVGVRL